MHFHLYIFLALLSIISDASTTRISKDDTVFTREQLSYLEGNGPRYALKWKKFYWPKSEMVYSYRDDLTSAFTKSMIEKAMRDISLKTCIKFRHTSDRTEPQVVIQDAKPGCWSTVGYFGKHGKMRINYETGCLDKQLLQHEILHALGFLHQQNAAERDEYVRINFENIQKPSIHNFNLQKTEDFGVGYDYRSIMHYGRYFFSKNGKETITPLQKGVKVGPANDLTAKDILKLNRAYCSKRKSSLFNL